VVSQEGSTEQPYQYVGRFGYYTHYQIPSWPVLQLGVRFYDPRVGRFTQEDPIGDGLNWYGYVGGNPLAWIDPWGLTKPTDTQCMIIRELLYYEKNNPWGPMSTARTAWRFSNTVGRKGQRMGTEFDDEPIPTSMGDIDLDWFTDLMCWHAWPSFLDYVTPLLHNEYIFGKTYWNVQQALKGHDPARLQIIYEDPKERVALEAVRRGLSYADLFPPGWEKDCPKECD